MTERLRDWAPELVVGIVVVLAGVLEIWSRAYEVDRESYVPLVLGFGLACTLARKEPFTALVLVWVTCALQLLGGVGVLIVELAVAVVAFGCARWGRPVTVALSGLSIPAAAAIGYLFVRRRDSSMFDGSEFFQDLLYRNGVGVGATVIALLGLLVIAVPWLAGLVLRATARAKTSEVRQGVAEADAAQAHVAAEQAREIARLRDQQATMARDVHDVVGHSLAVILAQAESGQYLADDDPAALKRTLATIATSARSSLQDVRQVLSGGPDPAAGTDAYEELLQGVRAGGHEVAAAEVGRAQPLPPELEVVAHRVVQEMLTNALKHGRRDRPVHVERHWPEGSWDRDLRIEVRNVAERLPDVTDDETQPLQAATVPPGQGIDGMRRRLDAVGGRLDVRRREVDGEPTFTATAWVPVSGR